ncbi:FIBCD1 [Cordylochernes scorpioides]|uniref:FIBCD1 n=1 Tax=Cordylochernes scorpioides TaxID=51811 RepID=A0ABY6KJ05_9ARAC|nr:FIBCD1 [Cordylochernes scorpioides]
MWTVEGDHSHAIYNHFKVGPESSNFTLTVDDYSGEAGDSLSYHSGSQFSTWDHYAHPEMRNCAAEFFGGWWYNDCHKVSLNGPYYRGAQQGSKYAAGIHWFDFTGHYNSLVRVQMMIRPPRPN